MSSQDLGISEQAISKTVEAGIKSQLDDAEALNVEIHTDPLKLAQGQIDSATLEGKGLVVKDDLRTEAIALETDAVNINLLKAAFGNIELEQPTDAKACVTLKAEDIEHAFNSGYVKQKLRGQKLTLPSGEAVTTDASNVRFTLPNADTFKIEADIMLIEKVETHHVAFTAKPQITEGGHQLTLVDVQYENDNNSDLELAQSLIRSTEDLLDLRNFEMGSMSLKFEQLDIKAGKLIVTAKANIQSLDFG